MPLPTTLAGKSKASFLPFYDPFTRANGPLVAPWQSGGATWTIVSNEAVNTPTEGGELVANGSMEAGDPPNSWAALQSTVDGVADERTGGAGIQSLDVARNANDNAYATQALTVVAGTWLAVNVWTRNVDSSYARVGIVDSPTVWTANNATVTWGNYVLTTRLLNANPAIWCHNRANGQPDGDSTRFDDVSAKPLTLNTLFSSVETSTTDVVCQVELDTVEARTQAGLVLNLDDKDTPANFVIAYHDGTKAVLEKCVAGVYTGVISAATAYAAGAIIQVTKSGTDYTLTYNSAQVGATSTINDAGIIDNTLHGMFSTYSGNQLDEFRCEKN